MQVSFFFGRSRLCRFEYRFVCRTQRSFDSLFHRAAVVVRRARHCALHRRRTALVRQVIARYQCVCRRFFAPNRLWPVRAALEAPVVIFDANAGCNNANHVMSCIASNPFYVKSGMNFADREMCGYVTFPLASACLTCSGGRLWIEAQVSDCRSILTFVVTRCAVVCSHS